MKATVPFFLITIDQTPGNGNVASFTFLLHRPTRLAGTAFESVVAAATLATGTTIAAATTAVDDRKPALCQNPPMTDAPRWGVGTLSLIHAGSYRLACGVRAIGEMGVRDDGADIGLRAFHETNRGYETFRLRVRSECSCR